MAARQPSIRWTRGEGARASKCSVEAVAVDPGPAGGEYRPAADKQRPAAGNRRPSSQRPAAASGQQRPAADEQRPAAAGGDQRQPAATSSNRRRRSGGQRPTSSGRQRPAGGNQWPASGGQRAATGGRSPGHRGILASYRPSKRCRDRAVNGGSTAAACPQATCAPPRRFERSDGTSAQRCAAGAGDTKMRTGSRRRSMVYLEWAAARCIS